MAAGLQSPPNPPSTRAPSPVPPPPSPSLSPLPPLTCCNRFTQKMSTINTTVRQWPVLQLFSKHIVDIGATISPLLSLIVGEDVAPPSRSVLD